MYQDVKRDNCPCVRKGECERHGNCEACVTHHRERGYPPSCRREEGQVYRNESNINERGYIYGKWMGADDTWTISYGNVYCYLLVGTEKALLIDTAYGEGDLRRFVEEITDKPVIVANTHGHFDHTGGNPWWKEAYMSAEAAKDAKNAFGEEMQKRLESMPYPDYKINIIDENTVFDLGGRTVKVVPIPAHHSGSVAFIDTWTISYGNVYCYLLVGTEKALLIDTAYGEGDLRRFVEEITDKPVIVANTHGHFDHTGGNPWWKEAYMSAEAAKDAKNAFGEEMQKRLESMPYPDYKINIIDENTVFDLGGRTVKVVSIPAHHPGSVAFIDSASRYLFTGDELEAGQVLMFLTEKDQMEAFNANMKKLLSLADLYDAVCPAHNGTPINKKYVSDFFELSKQILEGTQTEMPNTAGFGFPPKVGDTGPFSGDIRRAQYGAASICYKHLP